MSDEFNDSSAVQIDENNLDKECIRLPADYLRFAHLSADRKRELDEAEAELKVIIADAAKEVRANPEDFDIDKVTETAISATVSALPIVRKYVKRTIAARHAYDMAQAVVWSLEHKKRSLTLLVELHGMGYFSSVKMTSKGKEAVEQMVQGRVRRRHQED